MAPEIKVFLLEDFEAVRRGIAELLNAEPGLRVVGEAATVGEALRLAPPAAPDVAVLDVRLPDGNGVTACRELRSRLPGLQCVLLTSLGEEDALLASVLAGANGFLLKQVRGTDLAGAVRTVAAGRPLLPPAAMARALDRIRSLVDPVDSPATLTEAERATLALLSTGMTNRQIAERTAQPEDTVRSTVEQVLAKLGVQRFTRTSVAPLSRRT